MRTKGWGWVEFERKGILLTKFLFKSARHENCPILTNFVRKVTVGGVSSSLKPKFESTASKRPLIVRYNFCVKCLLSIYLIFDSGLWVLPCNHSDGCCLLFSAVTNSVIQTNVEPSNSRTWEWAQTYSKLWSTILKAPIGDTNSRIHRIWWECMKTSSNKG